MTIRLGRWFTFDTRHGFTLRLPLIGEAFVGGSLRAWSPWSELRRTGEV